MNIEPGVMLFQIIAFLIPIFIIIGIIVVVVILVKTHNENKRTSNKLDQILAHLDKENQKD